MITLDWAYSGAYSLVFRRPEYSLMKTYEVDKTAGINYFLSESEGHLKRYCKATLVQKLISGSPSDSVASGQPH